MTDCWEWEGARGNGRFGKGKGYGVLNIRTPDGWKMAQAHRNIDDDVERDKFYARLRALVQEWKEFASRDENEDSAVARAECADEIEQLLEAGGDDG